MAVTTAAIVGIAATAGTTAMSFTQASKQGKLQKQAEADAAKAMAEARKKLDVNFYEQLGIQKEPYELEREALLASGAQAIEAGVESERGAAATAGRVQMAQQQGQSGIRSAMGQEMLGLEKLAAGEESRLRDVGYGLDLGEAQGAQLAARDAEQAKVLSTQQGMQGVTSLGQQVAQALPLFSKSASVRELGRMENLATGKYNLSDVDFQKNIAALGTVDGVDFSKVSGMDSMKFKDFMGSIDPQTLKKITGNMPNTLQSFRPAEYALPNAAPSIYLNPFDFTGIK
jgi:hypothetical protein